MRPEELKAIRDRVTLVGAGEWFYHFAGGCIQPHSVMYKTRHGMSAICSTTYANESSKNDAEFIAHARQDVPALLEEVANLNIQIRELREENLDLRSVKEKLMREKYTAKGNQEPHFVQCSNCLKQVRVDFGHACKGPDQKGK